MKKEDFKLEKTSLGKLTSSQMSEILGGLGGSDKKDSESTKFTESYACCRPKHIEMPSDTLTVD